MSSTPAAEIGFDGTGTAAGGPPMATSTLRRVISPALRYHASSPAFPMMAVAAPLAPPTSLGDFQPIIKPAWGPEVQVLKQKVKDLEEAEQQLVESFTAKEQLSNEEMDLLEKKYSEQLESIREADLQTKDKLHRKFYRAKKKIQEQRQQQKVEQRTQRIASLLRDREQALRERLSQNFSKLCQELQQDVLPLEEELRRLRELISAPSAQEGTAAKERFGLELTNIATRAGGSSSSSSAKGVRVLRASGLALAAGIRSGDIITNATRAIDLQSREQLASVTPTVRPGDQMLLTLRRGNSEVQVILTVGRLPSKPVKETRQ